VVRATDSTEEEISAVAKSPFLYRRLRTAIEEKKTNSLRFFWGELFATFKVATIGMAAVALLAIGFFVFEPSRPAQTSSGKQTQPQPIDETTGLSNEELFADSMGFPNAVKEVKEVKK